MPDNNLQILYSKLQGNSTIKLPDYNTFEQKYNSEEGISSLYNKLSTNNTIKLPDLNTFKSKYFSQTPAKPDPYKSGLRGATYETRETLGDVKAETDTSGVRPPQYALPTIPKASEAEKIIKQAYQPDFLESKAEGEDYMSMGRVYQKQEGDKQAKSAIDFLKAKTHEDGTPITKEEKSAAVKNILNIFDNKKKNAEQALNGVKRTYQPLLERFQEVDTGVETGEEEIYAQFETPEYKQIYKAYNDQLNKYSFDSQMADKAQKELSQFLPEIVEIPTIDNIDGMDDDQLKKYFGEVGIDKTYIGKINDQENAEAAKIAYNKKQETYNDIYSLDSPFPFHSEDTQVKGNPQWVNEAFQKQGGYQVVSNFSDKYKKSVEDYQLAIEEYNEKIQEYNLNPTEEGYKQLEIYQKQILDPLKATTDKNNKDLKRLIKIQETSYPALTQWEQKQNEQLNLDLSTWEGQMTAAFRTLANKNSHIFTGLEKITTLPERLFNSKDEYVANRIAAQNRSKDLTFAVPEEYHKTPFMEGEFDISKPIESLKKINWSNVVAKNLETTAFSLEIAGVTAMTGGGANAIIPVTFAMTFGDNLYNARESGLNDTQASLIASFQSLIEGLTERISPLEAKIFNPATYTSGTLKQLTKEQIIKQIFKQITGKEIKEPALQYFLGKTKDLGKKTLKAGATGAYTILQETAEELAGDPLNQIVDIVASNNLQGYTYDPITLETLKNTAITSASTMALMGLWGAGTNIINPQVSSYNYDLATKPDYYLSSLQDALNKNLLPDLNLKNGQVIPKQEFYKVAQEHVKNLSSIYQANKSVIDNLEEKSDQARYVTLIHEQKKLYDVLTKYSPVLSSLTEKQMKEIEKIQSAISSYQESINSLNQQAFENLSLSKEERNKRQEEKVYEGTSKQFSDQFINRIVSPDQITYFKKNLQDRYTYAPTERMKELVSTISEKLDARLDYITNKPTTEIIQETAPTRTVEAPVVEEKEEEIEVTPEAKPNFEKAKEEINALPKEEVKSLRSLSQIEKKYPDLTEEEHEEIYNYVSDRLSSLEEEAKRIPTFKDKTGKEFSLTNEDKILVNNQVFTPISYENGRLKGTYLNKTQEISLNPQDFEISTDKEAINKALTKTKKEEPVEFIAAETLLEEQPEAPVSDKKADVEKTLYGTISGSIPLSQALPNGVYVDLGNGLFAYADKNEKIAAIVDKNNNYLVSKSFWNPTKNSWQLPNLANLKDDATKLGVDETAYIKKYQDAIDSLNKAELDALEKPTTTTEDLKAKKEDIEKRRKEWETKYKSKTKQERDGYDDPIPNKWTGLYFAPYTPKEQRVGSSSGEKFEVIKGISEEDVNNKIIAKYNAELDALKQQPVSNIETEEADIERRRQEELDRLNKIDLNKVAENSFTNKNQDNKLSSLYVAQTDSFLPSFNFRFQERPNAIEGIDSDFETINKKYLENKIEVDKFLNFVSTIDKTAPILKIESFYGKEAILNIDKLINAKYDAELAALEGKKEEKQEPKAKTKEELEQELNEINEKIKDVLVNDTPITATELEEIGKRKLELEKILNVEVAKVETVEEEIEKETEKQQEKDNKVVESKLQKVYSLLSTTPQQSTTTGVSNDPFIQTQATTLNKLKEDNESKSYEEMGVFVTVMNNNFPLDERHQPQNTLSAVREGKITEKRVKEGRIAVLTDKEGNVIYFDNEGNKTTSDRGVVIYQPLRGKIVNGKLDLSNQNVPTEEELKTSGELEKFNNEKQKLEEIRLSKEPITFKIEEITKGVSPFNKSETSKIDPKKYDITFKANGIVLAKDKSTGVESPIYRPNLQKAGLSDFVTAFMDMNNKEGLPENLIDSWQNRRTFLEKIIYTSSNTRRIRFDKNKLILTSAEKVEDLPLNIDKSYFNKPFEWMNWDGKTFTSLPYKSYQEFLGEHLTTFPISPSYNSYVKLGDVVTKEVKPVQEAPKAETPLVQTPITKEFTKSNRSKEIKINTDAKGLSGFGKNTELKRTRILGKKVTEAQVNTAKEWFEQYLKESGATFEDLRDIINSDVWATWSTAAIKLWQGGDFTDLYHEAFHDFTQLFLTKEQKKALYDELRKTRPGISDFEAEEILAEDFRKYMLSGQKLILNNRVKRNTIFRRIYNFLREFFTGNPSIEVVYQRLATQNIASYERNVDNALFGKLNKNVKGLTFTESVNLYQALDSLIAKQFREFGINPARLFKEKETIERAYQQVALDFKVALDENEADYNALVERYNKADDLTKQSLLPDITALDKLVNNLAFVLENFEEVKIKHLTESELLKVSKKFVPEEIINELEPETKDSIYDDKETESARDRASDQLIFIIGSLPRYINQNGEKVLAYNKYIDIIPDITPFDQAWNRLAKALTGTRDYKTMIGKIEDLIKTNPEYQYLLQSLPNPNIDGAELSLLEMQLRNQFINTFSQPYIPLKFASWWKDEKKQLRISVKEAIGKSYNLLKSDWDDNIQSIPNDYRILDEQTGQYFINIDKIAEDFKNLSKLRPKRKEEFLAAIGFTFSPQTIQSPEYIELLGDDLTLGKIYNAIETLSNLKNGKYPEGYNPTDSEIDIFKKPVVSIIDTISKSLYGNDLASKERLGRPVIVLLDGQKENIEKVQAIEISYSDKYFSDNLLNSENSNVWAIRPWSQQSVLYNYLNDPKFQTYSQLIADPVGSYFDISKNPDADNIFLHSVFDVVNDKRKTDRKGNIVKINLYNHNGLEINFGNETKGSKTTSLSRFEKLVQDIAPLLSSGNKEHIRYGDKTTSNGTEIIFSRISEGRADNPYLPVDISSFRETYLPKEAKAIFRRILHSALLQTNQYFVNNTGKNFSNFSENLEKKEYWGYFDGILSEKTKDKLIKEGLLEKELDIFKLIDENQTDIYKDIENFLKKDTEKTKKEINSNNLVSKDDFMPKSLFVNSNFGSTEEEKLETLYRAFNINSYILNLEHTRFMFQDPRFYNNKKGSYREPFKRYSKASSTGTIAVNDDQQNQFLQNSRLEKQQYDLKNPDNPSAPWTETGVENSVIFDDITLSAEDFVEKVDEIYKNAPLEEQLAVRKAYSDITSTDAMGICTFDWYRQFEIRSGNDNWNNEKEEIYKKIVANEPITEDETLKAFAFFPPKKIRVVGFVYDNKTKRFVPVDYKFAVSPLLPNLVKDKAYQVVKDNMIRQNVSLGLFKSASKHSAIIDNGKFNKLYNEDGSVNTGDYVTNPIHSEFIFEVVTSPEDYKEKITFSTQLRKLLFVNVFNNGIPIDFKGKNWDSLSEKEKLEQSKFYKLEQEFGEIIDKLVQEEKEKLLKSLDVKVDKNGNYELSEEKFSQLLEKEFKSRNLPNNVLKSVQTVNGKFKYALDASIQRETIEQVILSIVDNRLRKQKGLGESLIQASSIGYEGIIFERVNSWKSINGNDLPFYEYEGRTLPDGTKVTSAQKIKIALQGDFKKLLNLKDVKNLANDPEIIKEAKEKGGTYTPELVALNRLIKDEKWLDKNNHRELISITGVRIPVQGHNSKEFMEVYEFLPEEAGPIVIVSPALVAKSGGDFDWDKIASLFPSIHYNSYTKELKLFNTKDSVGKRDASKFKNLRNENLEKIEELKNFKKELKDALDVYKEDKNFSKLAKKDLKRSVKLLDIEIAVLNEQYDNVKTLYDLLLEDELTNSDRIILTNIAGEEIDFSNSEVVDSALQSILSKIKQRLEEVERIKTQLLPIVNRAIEESNEEINYTRKGLSTIESSLDFLRKQNGEIQDYVFRNSPIKAYNNKLNQTIRETLERPEIFESLITPNSTYMFEDIADRRLAAISTKKPSYSDIPTVTESLNQFESNTVGKQSLGIGAIWNTLFSQMQKAGAYLNNTYVTRIDTDKPLTKYVEIRFPHNKTENGNVSLSSIYSQLYKGTKYKISEVISQLINGWVDVAKKDWIFYINGRKEIAPTLLYTATTGVHKDVLVGFFNQPILYDYIKNLQNYKSQIVRLKNDDEYNNAKRNAIYETLKKYLADVDGSDLIVMINNKEENPWDDMRQGIITNSPGLFWSGLNKFRSIANQNKELFDPEYFMKFAIPYDVEGKPTLSVPTTEQENLAQALYLIQFLELQEQGNIVEKLRQVSNQDVNKPVNIQFSKERQVRRDELKQYNLIPEKIIDRITNQSVIKAFTHSKTGIDKFLQKLTENLFEVTNHPVFNRFLYDEFNKPTKDLTKFNYQTKETDILQYGNNIPFGIKFSIYEDWVKAVKNQFIEYLYQNYVYKPNSTKKVAESIFILMKPTNALALELENIKKTRPELVENNLLLQFLMRDNSREKVGGKPKYVNLKLRKDRIDSNTSNILTESFESLLSSDIPEIQQFARKLAHFAFIQSGLQKSPISFSSIIPQESYGEDISNIIKAFAELMSNNPAKAKNELQRFYDNYFKKYNRKFFVSEQVFDEETKTYISDIDFQSEAYRFRNFVDSRAYDLLSKKQNVAIQKQQEFLDSVKKMSSISATPFTENTAKENPNNFYIYEFNESKSGKLGSSKVREGGNNTAPIILMKQARVEGGNWTDETYSSNINLINSSISEAIAKIQQQKPTAVILPIDITEFSKLQKFAPKTAAYLYQAIQDNFGIDIKPAEFDNFKEAPAVEPTTPTQPSTSVKNFDKKNIFTVKPIQSADKKAVIKASIATQFIGFGEGITGSSTETYRQQAGAFANTGNYSSSDVIFVSIGGKRGTEEQQKTQQDRTIKEAIKAVEAGATILTDNKAYTDSSSYNTGEKRLYANMEAKGYNYSEVTVDGQVIGTWSKSTQPSTQPTVSPKILKNEDGLIIAENVIPKADTIKMVNQAKKLIEETSFKQTAGSVSWGYGMQWMRINAMTAKQREGLVIGKQLNGVEITQKMKDNFIKTANSKGFPLYGYTTIDKNGNKLPSIPQDIINYLASIGIDVSEYDASYNSVYDKTDNGSLIIHQDNTETNKSPIITISLGRPMKFVTYELKDPNDFNVADSNNTAFRIAVNAVQGEALKLNLVPESAKDNKGNVKYGHFTPDIALKYAQEIDKKQGTNLKQFVIDKLKEQFKNAEKTEYTLNNGAVLVFSGNNRNVLHEIVFDPETNAKPMESGFPTLKINKAFKGLGQKDNFVNTSEYRMVLTLRKVEGKTLTNVVNQNKLIETLSVQTPTVSTEVKGELFDPRLPKVNIYASTGENAELSNFAERPFEIDGDKFNTVEGAYQAAKIYYILDNITKEEEEYNKQIFEQLKTATGSQAKSLGKKIKKLDVKLWDVDSSNMMYLALEESFKQNPEALQKLLATGNAELTHTQDKGKWGKEFPKLLMEVRQELTQPTTEEIILKDGKSYNKQEINSKMLEKMGYTPMEIGKLLKEICG